MPPGRFITLEGGEGAGKTTQARRLADRLRAAGYEPVITREPGGSPAAEAIRDMLLSGRARQAGPLVETMLFYAARQDHLDALVRPALAAGRWVVCDRFSDSTRAYQGAAAGVAGSFIEALERVVVGPTRPDLTLVLDLAPEIGLARARTRNAAAQDRFEGEDLAFHQALREALLDIAAREPARCAVVDAARPADEVAEEVWGIVEARLRP